MSFFAATGFAVFILILFAGIYLTLFGLPGTMIIFLDIFFYALFTGFNQVSGKIILFLLFISIIAETIDFFLVMGGALQPVASKKSFWTAVLGAIVGAFLLTPFFGDQAHGEDFF